MKLKTAKEWSNIYWSPPERVVRAIQAEALRYAADKLTRHSGDWQSIIADLQYEASKLEKENAS